MERWAGKVAIVTGASSGIGRAICVRLAQAGLHVLGLGRNEERLRTLAEEINGGSGSFRFRLCDVCDDEQLRAAFDFADTQLGALHVLVNAAGVWSMGFLCQSDFEHTRATFATNAIAVCVASRMAIEAMTRHAVRGHILNLNSILGHEMPTVKPPIMGAYPATKHALAAISASLNQEMSFSKTGIKVTSLNPDIVDTDMFAHSLKEFDVQTHKSRLPKGLTAEEVADVAVYVLSTPDTVLVKELALMRNQ